MHFQCVKEAAARHWAPLPPPGEPICAFEAFTPRQLAREIARRSGALHDQDWVLMVWCEVRIAVRAGHGVVDRSGWQYVGPRDSWTSAYVWRQSAYIPPTRVNEIFARAQHKRGRTAWFIRQLYGLAGATRREIAPAEPAAKERPFAVIDGGRADRERGDAP